MACELQQQALDDANDQALILQGEINDHQTNIAGWMVEISTLQAQVIAEQTALNNKLTARGTLVNETIPNLETELNNCLANQ